MINKDITSVKDFYTRFCPTEETAEAYFKKILWDNKLQCPYCDFNKICKCKDKRYKCSQCNRKFTIKTGTFMQASHIPLQQWIYALYVMKINKKGISSIQLSEELGITQKSAWYMAQKIRECFIESVNLEGTIEMDETFIGGKEKNKHERKKLKKGRGTVGKVAVMGAIDREEKKAVAHPVPKVNGTTVGAFINKNIQEESTIYADECTSYNKYTKLRVNHGEGEYVNGDIHINGIESFWATIKRGYIGVYHWWSKKHLRRYINEFVFRYNNKANTNIEFIKAVIENGKNKVTTFKDITR